MNKIKKLDAELKRRYGPSKPGIDAELDELYDAIDVLMKNNCWSFLDGVLEDFIPRIWRTDIDILLGYLTATLPYKSKIPARVKFLDYCRKIHYYPELWKGLD